MTGLLPEEESEEAGARMVTTVTLMLALMACMSIMPKASKIKCPYRLGQHEQQSAAHSRPPPCPVSDVRPRDDGAIVVVVVVVVVLRQ